MRKSLIATSALAALIMAAPAYAADMAVKARPLPPPVPVFTWSGFYVGGHVGWGWGDFDFRDPFVQVNQPILIFPGLFVGVPLERSFSDSSFLGGLQAGVNAQFGPVVVGVESDVSWMSLGGEFRSSTSNFGGLVTTSEGVSAKLDWLATARGRLGWASDRILVYGTAGVAFGGVDAAGDITLTTAPVSIPGIPPIPPGTLSLATSDRKTHVGWTAGAGIEGAIWSNWSVKFEYLYTDLGWLKHEGPLTIGGTLAPLLTGTSLSGGGEFKAVVQTVKLGLNYRFDWGWGRGY
jgi:outer membrane immunogenic protein